MRSSSWFSKIPPPLAHTLSAAMGGLAAITVPLGSASDLRPLRTLYTVERDSGGTLTEVVMNPTGLVLFTATLLTLFFLSGVLLARLAPGFASFAGIRLLPPEKAKESGLALSVELSRMLSYVRTYGNANDRFEKALRVGQARLPTLKTQEQIQAAVGSLLDENERMRMTSADLKSQLFETERRLKEVQHDLSRAEEQSRTDALTGVANRRVFDEALSREVSVAQASRNSLALVMCDLDRFKSINDTHGHTVGDEVLRMFATLLKNNMRAGDVVARYGGEEFSILLPGTPLKQAGQIAERIRSQLEEQTVTVRATKQKLGKLTASFGVAELKASETGESLVVRADARLYDAKGGGRNRVAIDET